MGGFDGLHVWFHDVEQLLTHGISVVVGIATVEAVLANLPRRHALKLHFDQAANFVFADVSSETVGEVVEDFGVFGEDNS